MSRMPTKWRSWIALVITMFAASGYLAIRNLGVGELRGAAKIAAKWAPRVHEPGQGELGALPERARFMIDSQCNKEGGNPFAQRNCYAEAAQWMLEEAREREPRRDLGFSGMGATAFLGVASWLARRSAQKRELHLQ